MSVHDRSPCYQPRGTSENSSKSTGTLTGTLTNLTNGASYPVQPSYFYRFGGDAPRIHVSIVDPETPGGTFDLYLNFLKVEPDSGTYTVGEPGWPGCGLMRFPNEEVFRGISGELKLRNFQSLSLLEGELEFDTLVGSQGEKFRIDVKFTVSGW